MSQVSLLSHLFIDEHSCHMCKRCLAAKACKGMAIIRFGPDETPVIDMASCRHCYDCVDACPFGAVQRG